VTIRAMPRVLLAVSILFAAPACQRAQASKRGPTPRERQLAAGLDALEAKVRHIRTNDDHLARLTRKTWEQIASVEERLDSLVATLDHFKLKLKDASSAAAGAASEAGTAAARAADLARRLAVLEKRFDYHLKHPLGGG
jgi:septal ring factor EnvC (AmiA/AmiB activator)